MESRPQNAFWSHFSTKFPHYVVRLITVCSEEETCWKSIGKGRFQTIIPCFERKKLLASPSAQTLSGRVPLSLLNWCPASIPLYEIILGKLFIHVLLPSAVKIGTGQKKSNSAQNSRGIVFSKSVRYFLQNNAPIWCRNAFSNLHILVCGWICYCTCSASQSAWYTHLRTRWLKWLRWEQYAQKEHVTFPIYFLS